MLAGGWHITPSIYSDMKLTAQLLLLVYSNAISPQNKRLVRGTKRTPADWRFGIDLTYLIDRTPLSQTIRKSRKLWLWVISRRAKHPEIFEYLPLRAKDTIQNVYYVTRWRKTFIVRIVYGRGTSYIHLCPIRTGTHISLNITINFDESRHKQDISKHIYFQNCYLLR